jgi:hypothetical protein
VGTPEASCHRDGFAAFLTDAWPWRAGPAGVAGMPGQWSVDRAFTAICVGRDVEGVVSWRAWDSNPRR